MMSDIERVIRDVLNATEVETLTDEQEVDTLVGELTGAIEEAVGF